MSGMFLEFFKSVIGNAVSLIDLTKELLYTVSDLFCWLPETWAFLAVGALAIMAVLGIYRIFK